MNKKIGVCCVFDHRNYGSMLQTLATIEKLEQMGYDYEIIHYTKKLTLDLLLRSLDRIPEEIKTRVHSMNKNKKMDTYPEIKDSIKIRNSYFDNFKKSRFTKVSKPYHTFKELQIATENYSAVLVGSDQLWVPKGYSTGFFNLLFVPEKVPKLAYATSFGVSEIPQNKKKVAKYFLDRMDYISVRELRASEMIEELTGRKVPTVVDPTILFTGEEWKEIIKEKKIIKGEKYIFCYFLGNNPEQRLEVEKLKKATGYKIVFIPHLDEFIESDIKFGDEQLYKVGPEEFVNLIRNAEYVCTDSFHGSVFSILNHKKFVTFNRFKTSDTNSRNSRIDSLLKQTGLMQRRYAGDLIKQIEKNINYDEVESRLTKMREKSEIYLETALKSIDK